MTLQAVLFDVGDTLLTERTSRYAIYAEVARRHGRNLTPKTMQRVMGTAHDDIPARIGGAFRYSDPWFRAFIHRIFFQNLGLAPQEVAAITEELFERFNSPETFRVFPGATELLGELRSRGLTLGVVSNWSEQLETLLENHELRPYFDVVLASASVGMEKPDPAIFDLALERLGVPAAAVLHVGDHPEKDGAARSAGLDVVLVDHGGRLDPESADGLPVVAGFDELGALLDRRLAS